MVFSARKPVCAAHVAFLAIAWRCRRRPEQGLVSLTRSDMPSESIRAVRSPIGASARFRSNAYVPASLML